MRLHVDQRLALDGRLGVAAVVQPGDDSALGGLPVALLERRADLERHLQEGGLPIGRRQRLQAAHLQRPHLRHLPFVDLHLQGDALGLRDRLLLRDAGLVVAARLVEADDPPQVGLPADRIEVLLGGEGPPARLGGEDLLSDLPRGDRLVPLDAQVTHHRSLFFLLRRAPHGDHCERERRDRPRARGPKPGPAAVRLNPRHFPSIWPRNPTAGRGRRARCGGGLQVPGGWELIR